MQAEDDALRPQALCVIVVIPDLGDGNVDGLRIVRVGNDKAFFRTSAHLHFISGHFLFGYGIVDLLAVLILRHVCKTELPFAVLIRRNRDGIHRIVLICQKRKLDILRTQSVCILTVFPGLCAGDRDEFRIVRVRYGEAVIRISGDLRFVSFYRHFFDGVKDFFTALCLRQLVKRECPGIRRSAASCVDCGNVDAPHFFAIRQQSNRYFLRTKAILIICVLPDLGALDGDLFRIRIDHFVGDLKAF